MGIQHLVTLLDWEPAQISEVLSLAHRTKAEVRHGRTYRVLEGKTLALLFEKPSMRTRVSFQVAMAQLGGQSVYLSRDDVGLGRREPVKDGARVLSRYVSAVAARVYKHSSVEELAAYSTVPVINALSDRSHPCQALADMMTIEEKFPSARGIWVAYIGDANNVAWSLGIICGKLGISYTVASPPGYQFDDESLGTLRQLAAASGASFTATDSAREAAEGSQVLYTDTWVSMGQEEEAEQRRRDLADYCVDAELLDMATDDAIVMHCLPAYRGREITDEVIEGPQSVVFEQAENRLHVQRALLQRLIAH